MRARILVVVVGLVLLTGAASAEASGEADLSDELRTGAQWRSEESDNGEDDSAKPEGSNNQEAPYVVRRVTDYYLDQPCGAEPDHVIAAVRYVEIDPATEEERVLHDTYECLPIPWSDDPETSEEELPPPRAVDVRDAVSRRLPTPVLAANPYPEGLTGLETYLWYADDGASQLEPVDTGDGTTRPGLRVTATAGPYEITATAWITQFRWSTGDGATYTSTHAGSEDDPAASHMYETKGDYTVVTETVWVGRYTWNVGVASGSGDLGSVTRRSSHHYPVVEARSALTR